MYCVVYRVVFIRLHITLVRAGRLLQRLLDVYLTRIARKGSSGALLLPGDRSLQLARTRVYTTQFGDFKAGDFKSQEQSMYDMYRCVALTMCCAAVATGAGCFGGIAEAQGGCRVARIVRFHPCSTQGIFRFV